MMIACLARHPAINAPPGLCYGRLDVQPAEGWEGFATVLAQAIKESGARCLYASPLARCHVPAVYAAALAQVPLVLDPRLQEMDFGLWEGQRWDDIPRDALDQWAADLAGFQAPGGENGHALCQRVAEFYAGLPPGAPCAVLSHGGPLRVLHALAEAREPDLACSAMPLGQIMIRGKRDVSGDAFRIF